MTLDPTDPKVLHLKAPNKVTFDTIGKVLERLESPLKTGRAGSPREILLDMTSVAFCSPTGITILAAAIETLFLGESLQGGEIWMPRSPLLVQYLQRMNFFIELQASMPEGFERHEAKGFHPVTRVRSEQESPAATRALAEAVQEHARLDDRSLGALKSCLNEVVENVFYHANSPIDALVCAQAVQEEEAD